MELMKRCWKACSWTCRLVCRGLFTVVLKPRMGARQIQDWAEIVAKLAATRGSRQERDLPRKVGRMRDLHSRRSQRLRVLPSRCQRSLRAKDMPSPRSVCCLEWPRTVRSCVLAACPAVCEPRLTSTPAAVPPLTTWVVPRPAPRPLLDTRPGAHLVTSATEYPGGHLNSHHLVSGLGAGGADSPGWLPLALVCGE